MVWFASPLSLPAAFWLEAAAAGDWTAGEAARRPAAAASLDTDLRCCCCTSTMGAPAVAAVAALAIEPRGGRASDGLHSRPAAASTLAL